MKGGFIMMKKQFEILSPRSGEQYNLLAVLRKFFQRRNFGISSLEKVDFEGAYPYGDDYDGVIHIKACTSESQWCESIDAELAASVPFHVSGWGKIKFGELLSKDPTSSENPDYYKQKYTVTITGYLGDQSDSIEFDWFDENFDEEKTLIIEIVKSAIIRTFLRE